MKKIILNKALSVTLLLLSLSSAHASSEADIQLLVKNLLGTKNTLKTSGCKIQKEKWALILITKEAFQEKIAFNQDCDIAGKFKVEMDKLFPFALKIRNFLGYKTINGNAKFEIIFKEEMILKINLKEAQLIGKKRIQFDLNYQASIDPLNPEKPLKKQLGGSVLIRKVDGKDVNKSYPLN